MMKRTWVFCLLLSAFLNAIDIVCGFSFNAGFIFECDGFRFNNCDFTITDLKIEPLENSSLTLTDFTFLGAALGGKQVGRLYSIFKKDPERIAFLEKQRQEKINALRATQQKKELEEKLKLQEELTRQEQLRQESDKIDNKIKKKLRKLL